ncbi:MAG: DCC1-like thiol-disulfide oxidoreductase family protein [Verrucomicrobium sp.]|nr:DCC1-like thiol-disulfide oxidoreductase family protein [Verrucomicrobium sp.]
MAAPSDRSVVVYFDGVCNLCNGFVDFLVRRDRARRLRYAPQQGPTYAALRVRHPELPLPESGGRSTENVVTVVTENGGERIYHASDAVRAALAELPGGWGLLRLFGIVPRFLRDGVYKVIARNRYKLFGKRETCRLPSPEEKALFWD